MSSPIVNLISYDNTGRYSLTINGKYYTGSIDPARLEYFLNLLRYHPGRAINYLKRGDNHV
jgi:hypothetical protein